MTKEMTKEIIKVKNPKIDCSNLNNKDPHNALY